MPRSNGRRYGTRPLAITQAPGRCCIGCPAPVSEARLACPRCWGCLGPDLREPLRGQPEDASPEALAAAKRFLAAGAMARTGESR